MSTDYGRFGITLPDDSDSPNAPAQFRTASDDLQARLGYAGAQGGKSVVDAEQSRTNTAYDVLGTPDRISNLLVPRNHDLIIIGLTAEIKSSVASAGSAALYLVGDVNGVVQVAVPTGNPPPGGNQFVEAFTGPTANRYGVLATSVTAGLTHVQGSADAAERMPALVGIAGDGGIIAVRVLADTWDVEVRYKATSGSVSARNRRLWAWTKEFPATGI